MLPALAKEAPRASFVFYRMTGTRWIFFDQPVVSLDPYTGARVAPVQTLKDLAPSLSSVSIDNRRPISLGMDEFLLTYILVLRLQRLVWQRFLSSGADRLATDNEVASFAGAWRALMRPDVVPIYEHLSGEFEGWLQLHVTPSVN